ncbi:WG repeat-containing protein [Pollutimonas bauzanensis]|uniref:WG repeat-containing protein n=1 Tax=Pollutimonas bauzanensis TaxID=658167 RepID=UPI00333ED045
MRKVVSFGIFSVVVAAAFSASAQDYDRYGHALISDAEGWVYVDRNQRPLIRPYIFDNGPDYFEEGLARFVKDGKMGFHDKALNIVIPARYDFVFPFQDGAAKAGTNCRRERASEHTSVYCEKWESLSKPEQ